MRLLTFNHHESYLCSLARTGHALDVVVRGDDLELPWRPWCRPPPPNVRLVDLDAATRRRLADGAYDAVVCHTVRDLARMAIPRAPRFVFCAHVPLYAFDARHRLKATLKKATLRAFSLRHPTQFMAVSEMKRAAWGMAGPVVQLAPEPMPACAGAGAAEASALVVCNDLERRRGELGARWIEALRRRVPVAVVGHRNGAAGTLEPQTFAEFQSAVSRHRIYLYTVEQPWGDGYNTALLEAMAMGMAVVTVPNPSSPIEHGTSGLVGSTIDELAAHVRRLIADPVECARLGLAARRRVEQAFSSAAFVAGWNAILSGRASAAGAPQPAQSSTQLTRA